MAALEGLRVLCRSEVITKKMVMPTKTMINSFAMRGKQIKLYVNSSFTFRIAISFNLIVLDKLHDLFKPFSFLIHLPACTFLMDVLNRRSHPWLQLRLSIRNWKLSLIVFFDQNHRWFHGDINRIETERRLNPCEEGMFLIRNSVNYEGDYTLSVWYVCRLS